jgi:hypothetical protein
MTIETATPSSAEAVAALFDNLVEAVAQRVLAQLDASIAAHVGHALESADFEDKVEASVQTAIDSMDLHDQVLDIVQDLTFDVRVSR